MLKYKRLLISIGDEKKLTCVCGRKQEDTRGIRGQNNKVEWAGL